MRRNLVAVSAVLLVAAGCSESQAQSGGPTVSRAFQVGNFTGLEVMGPFNVQVTTGKPVAVTAQGPRKLVESMVVEVRDGKLVIRPRKKGWFGGMMSGSGGANVSVSVPALTAVEVAGSGDIDVDRVAGERFSGAIAGSGNIRLPQVAVQELALEIAGSGEMRAAGQARQARYEIAGSGDLDASGLTAAEAQAEIAGSGNIRARVTGNARASIAGSGDIEISGGARCQTSKAGNGNIRCS